MKRHFLIAGFLALASSFALAQNMPRQKDPQQSTMPQTQQQPSTADQQRSATTTATGDPQGDIQAALQKDPSLGSSNINVQVSGTTVELSGTVPSEQAKDDAEQIVKAHSGGMTVKNHLKVAAPPK
jgi:osmotically-inducible protein OsmY